MTVDSPNTTEKMLKVAISAGELSGDQHASHVVEELRKFTPIEVRGMGGHELRRAGVDTVIDCYTQGGAMGVTELLGPLGKILRALKVMKNLLSGWRPDVLILVDYPDFNMRLAKTAKKLGIPVYWYIPPKIWAWRSGRIKSIRRYADRLGVIFPFEKSYYEERQMTTVDYVGHPVCSASDLINSEVVEEAAARASIPPDARPILLLPGSRNFEVDMILRPMLRAVCPVLAKDPRALGVVVVAPSISDEKVSQAVAEETREFKDRIVISRERADLLMRRAKAGILKSGTCTLEAACAGMPFVCLYSGTHFANIVIRRIIKLKEFSPVNIIRASTVPELIQVHLDSETIRGLFEKIYWDGPDRTTMERGLADVRHLLRPAQTSPGESVAQRVAKSVLSMVETT